jgi:uncharacterized protein (DUF1501 family)
MDIFTNQRILSLFSGNHFILGGSVKGGKVHGKYPDDLTDDGKLNIGRGRLIPTTPWEGVWNGLAEWFGVNAANRNSILPNKVRAYESRMDAKVI